MTVWAQTPPLRPRSTDVLVVWPHGLHHYIVRDVRICADKRCRPGWMYFQAVVISPDRGPYPRRQEFLGRRTDYGFELMPANRDPVAIWTATRGLPDS